MNTASDSPILCVIDEATKIGEVRRAAVALAARIGFDETARGKLALVTTEAASNLHKHAREGVIILQGVEQDATSGVELLVLDRGPGMTDIARCLADGYSTAGSPGHGLSAMARLADGFDIHSTPGLGTALWLQVWPTSKIARAAPFELEVGAVNLPLAGESVCGDAWATQPSQEWSRLFVVDGLGHGPQAAEAARCAVRVFHAQERLDLVGILQATHEALRSTRGAAVAIAELDRAQRLVRFAGIGNIAGVILSMNGAKRTSMVSHNGIMGHTVRKFQEFVYPWEEGAALVMHSDGLTSHWHAERYPGLMAHHPALVAGVLYRDFTRGRDDVTVLVARESSGGRP